MLRLTPFLPDHSPEHKVQASHGPAYTIFDEFDHLVCCGGVMVPWQGMGTCWFYLNPNQRHRVREMYRILIQTLVGIITTYGLVRLEAHVDAEFAAGLRFARHLGFECESIMRRWGPGGRDHAMMALVRL